MCGPDVRIAPSHIGDGISFDSFLCAGKIGFFFFPASAALQVKGTRFCGKWQRGCRTKPLLTEFIGTE